MWFPTCGKFLCIMTAIANVCVYVLNWLLLLTEHGSCHLLPYSGDHGLMVKWSLNTYYINKSICLYGAVSTQTVSRSISWAGKFIIHTLFTCHRLSVTYSPVSACDKRQKRKESALDSKRNNSLPAHTPHFICNYDNSAFSQSWERPQ